MHKKTDQLMIRFFLCVQRNFFSFQWSEMKFRCTNVAEASVTVILPY